MPKINFGKVVEDVITIKEFPLSTTKKILSNQTIVILGYGIQGRAQGLNLRDNKVNVIVGQRKNSNNWNKAIADGWIPNKTLFPLEQAQQKGDIIVYLLSDAGQKEYWPKLKPHLIAGKTLIFAHGFSIVYSKLTHVIPPKNIDVVVVAPKGSGLSLRQNYLDGNGLASAIAIHQDYSGNAKQTACAVGIAIGSPILYSADVKREVYGDLVGERGVLVGALAGLMEAQYQVLRKHGHTPSEAFNDTVEELTQGLMRLVGERGMDYLLANISTTAQRGALDWKETFKKATLPVFEDLYKKVANGTEAQIVLDKNSARDYRKKLDRELEKVEKSEIWQAGSKVRSLRPKKSAYPD